MRFNNLGSVARTVDGLIGESYPVVKEVYKHLEEIKDVQASLPVINNVEDRLDEIHKIQDAADSLIDINEALGDIKEVQDHLKTIEVVAPHGDNIDIVAENIDSVLEAHANALSAAQSAKKAKASEVSANESERLAKDWAIKEDVVEGNFYSSRHYAQEAKNAKEQGQEILDENREIEKYHKSMEGTYKVLREKQEDISVTAGNINSVVNVATDLKGETIDDGSRDLGMIGEDGDDAVTSITGGNIKKVADDIISVRITANNIEDVRQVADAIDRLPEIKKDLFGYVDQALDHAEESKKQADLSKTSADNALKSEKQAKIHLDNVIAEGPKSVQVIKNQEALSKQAVIAEGDKQVERVTSAGSQQITLATAQADEAKKQAGIATTKAQEASTSATTAQTAASKSKDWSEKLDGPVSEGQYSARFWVQRAEQESRKAQSNATTATTEAQKAATSAEAAKTSETNAKTSETEAKKQADIAKEYASQATANQVNSDWAITDTTSKAYIRNKPNLSIYAVKAETDTALASKAHKSHVHTEGDVSGLTAKLNTKADKTAIADMLTKTEAGTTYLGKTAKAESAKVADSVAWANVTGKEKVRTTDTLLKMSDFGSIDLGMIGE